MGTSSLDMCGCVGGLCCTAFGEGLFYVLVVVCGSFLFFLGSILSLVCGVVCDGGI